MSDYPPLSVTVHPYSGCGIACEATCELRRMQAEDITNSINKSCSNQCGVCFGLNPNRTAIYWTGLFILAGAVVGAIVIRKVRK